MDILEQSVLAYIDENKEELFNLLAGLISVDTQNFRTHGNENSGQEYLKKLCESEGLLVDVFVPDSVPGLTDSDEYNPGRGTDKRNNLVASFKGAKDENAIMLAAHMDTERVGDLSKWTVDPFSGLIKDGKIYGRGAGDDKFGLAAALFVIKALKANDFTPQKNILIGSYIDEEGGGGNGALGLCMKYPCECYVNLDGLGFEKEAFGGQCFTFSMRTTKNDEAVACIYDVFDGIKLAGDELRKLEEGRTTVRLSSIKGGENGEKCGSLVFAVYTDKTKEEIHRLLNNTYHSIKPELDELYLESDGFVPITKFFRYGKTQTNSKEANVLFNAVNDIKGSYPDIDGSCLSDLSVFMHFGSKNSFNFGMPVGSDDGGGVHQPDEHIYCDDFVNFAKSIALLLLRI